MGIKAPQVLVFLVCAASMVAVLSVLRYMFWVQADGEFWSSLSGAGEEVAELRAAEAMTLSGGSLPLERAMERLASRGRENFREIRPSSGEHVPPAAGWVHDPDFEDRVKYAQAVEARLAARAADAGVADAAPDATVE